MTISDIQLVPGTSFQVNCRIRSPRRREAANGSQYLSFMIEDCNSIIKAYAWPEKCDITKNIHDLDKVQLSGMIREFNGNPLAAVTSIHTKNTFMPGAVNLIPHSLCPAPQLLDQLHTFVSRVSYRPLSMFLDSVFSDDGLALPFIRLPASKKHHHSEPGGLLKHSLECADMVRHFMLLRPEMLDLAVVAALLHDAGKIVTLHNQKFSPEYVLLDHDALTLEVLAPHLKLLDGICRETATALRYIWTWRNSRRAKGHPALVIAEAIAAADRISTGLDMEDQVFSDKPDWQVIAHSETYGDKYWRPLFGSQQIRAI